MKTLWLFVAAIAMSTAACAAASSPEKTTLVIYVTPPPTPIVIYVTPAPTALVVSPTSAPIPTVKPTRRPTPKPTPKPTATPVSEDQRAYERLIAARIPEAFRDDCVSKLHLPPNALAGLECEVRAPEVKLVGYYIFDTKTAMEAAYYNRLTEYGINAGSGYCADGIPGDNVWWYIGGYAGEGRLGCFVNENGNANLRWTVEDFLIYAGIVGRGPSITNALQWWSEQAGPFEYSPY